MCWILLITVSLLPLLELLENKSFNEKFFFATSLITTTGFDLKNYMYKDELILKIWVALIQCIGALYTILVFVMYFSTFLNKNNKIMVINKNNILLINLLFLFYLIFFTIILKVNKFDLIEGFSLSAIIFSSGGIRINNSIYLDYNINYFLIISFMLFSLLFLPLFLLLNNKKLLKNAIRLFFKNTFFFIIFLIFVITFFILTAPLEPKKNLLLFISIITTTGILPHDFENTNILNQYDNYVLLFIFMAFVGTFSGTSNGGIKLNRLSLFFINIKEEFNRFLFQYNVKGIDILKDGSSQSELNSFYATICFLLFFIILCMLILNISGLDFKSAFVYVLAALSNTGEGLIVLSDIHEYINPKYYFVLNILMICGRFEHIGYLLLLNKVIKKY